MLLAAPQDAFKTLNLGTATRVATPRGTEAVWAFKDEKAASVTAVEILVPGREQYSLKDFEVFVSEEAPTGPFKSLGSFSTINARVTGNGQYQRFELPPTTAKYVKIAFKSGWSDSYIALYGIRVMGTP